MSDDLVKRLRDMNGGWASDEALAAADRIEELETENAKLKKELCEYACQNTDDMNDIIALGMVRDQQADRIKELEEILSLRTNLHGEAIYLVEALEAERDALKAKLAKAVEAIEEAHQAMLDSCDSDAFLILKNTLEELKGELK